MSENMTYTIEYDLGAMCDALQPTLLTVDYKAARFNKFIGQIHSCLRYSWVSTINSVNA